MSASPLLIWSLLVCSVVIRTSAEEAESQSPAESESLGRSSDPGIPLGLSGRLAIVTGGASGIGRSVCMLLARENVTVIVADKNMTGGRETIQMLKDQGLGGQHKAMYVDVRYSSAVKDLFDCIESQFPDQNVSILVNSAGILHKPAPLQDINETVFDNTISTNLKGTYLVTRAVVVSMLANNITNGAIVNIASIVGKAGFPNVAAYVASKGGVIAFTKTVALELAQTGIRVNVVLPGGTDTPMAHQWSNATKYERMKDLIPMHRYARPEEIAEVILFLCSMRASYMTGASIDIAGGSFL